MSLAAKLSKERLRKGQSLQEVADDIGVSKTHIWQLEKGRSVNPSLDLITKLANHYDVSIRFLVGEDMEQNDDEDLIKMFRQVGQLDENDRFLIDQMVQSLLARKEKNDA
ncbi:hypothetical protein TH5_22980 [Thalassospira xianhensis MCCC 1A02616]|uniref:HTH cro/C1-type domain-containing protein n=2 Tax=Thalassospira xianhensis TaxID=478503 RepID=A0A367U6G7_9PROT|nr:hypothetical protein TH5_22980 [Thalassospira xianhensis MCCC 1A02616]